jgi:hypothetical protein
VLLRLTASGLMHYTEGIKMKRAIVAIVVLLVCLAGIAFSAAFMRD